MSDRLILMFCAVFGGIAVLMTLYFLFLYMPASAYADLKCTKAGYPYSRVTVDLSMFCMSLDGAVTVTVRELKDR